jgi:Transcriptional regulatory protein, C terminal/AAA ATPase domain
LRTGCGGRTVSDGTQVTTTIESSLTRAASGFVGRELELERLASGLGDGGPTVTFVHGAPGVGKSALLAALAADAMAGGVDVVRIECRDVEPTPAAFLDELGRVLGSELDDLGRLSAALASRGGGVVIALDTYERFRLIDRWVREELVSALPTGAKLVLAGRDAPQPTWLLSAPSPTFFVQLPLGRLTDAEAVAFLRGAGLADDAAERLGRLARGHPLTLRLAAAAGLARPELEIDDQAAPAVFEALTRLYVADLPAPTRRALDAASVLRRVTLPLLAAMLTNEPPGRAFERLANLPFVEVARDGLVLHEALQEAIARRLRATDPERYRRHRTLAWRQLRREVRAVTRNELWRYTADMLYLIENPIVREAFFPASSQRVSVAPATLADRADMLAIAGAYEPAPEAELLQGWLEFAPDAWRVARTERGVSGFAIVTTITDIPATIRQADPAVRAWREHLRANPVAPGENVLALRRWLDRDCGEAPSPTQAALWLDIKRTYMELRPALRRLYAVLRDPVPHLPAMLELGFVPLELIDVGGTSYQPSFLDFGAGSVDGWLAGLAAREIGVDDSRLLDPEARELVIDGRRVPLTRIELALAELLVARADGVASRREILRTVWQTDHEGSNVIEAAVGSLRRKLGPEAHRLETVRGVGYRLRAG